jgi:hypothetical protein
VSPWVEANFYKYQPFLRRAALMFVREHRAGAYTRPHFSST